jgi:hypothetical protein
VFDGHAGKTTADFAAMHTPQLLHMALTGTAPAMSGGAGWGGGGAGRGG